VSVMSHPNRKHVARTALGTLCVFLGLFCLAAAGIVGVVQMVCSSVPAPVVFFPDLTPAGIAVAGGLCFVAAAISEAAANWPRPPDSPDRSA
jgi:hypothetical protein